MALDLSSIAFKVETKELDDAVSKLGDLQKAVSNLNKPLNASTLATEKLAQAQAKTAKANADAAAATAKAELAQARLEKTTTGNALAQAKLAKTTETTTTVTKNSTTALERQQQILEYMTQGFSKGQSSVLTYAKSTGLLSNELEELGKVLQTQRKLVGGDPFDKSTGGLESLKNKLTEAREANRLYTAGIDLTASQTKELARDKERIIEKMKLEGASLTDIKNKLKEHNTAYIAVADAVNRLDRAETAKMATDKATGKATDYLTREMNRAENALAGLNNEVAISSSNRLLRFKESLIASGMATDVAAAKYQAYAKVIAETDKKRVAQQKSDEQSRINNLSRGLAPQISDVAVSLYGGMSPMTVLMQQGLQVRDLIQSSGVEAGKLNEVMRKTGADFVSTLTGTFRAVGSMVVGTLQSAGANVTKFAMDTTGAGLVLENFRYQATLASKDADSLTASLGKAALSFSNFVTSASSVLVGGGIAVGIVALVTAIAVTKQLIKEESELSTLLNLNGAALGLNRDAAYSLAATYAGARGDINGFAEAISESAKAGNITSDSLQTVTQSAVYMKSVAGVAIADTVKQFSEIAKDPVKALEKLAISLGTIDPEILKVVRSLEEQGKQAEAASIATAAYAEGLAKAGAGIKNDMGFLESFFKTIGSAASSMWDKILNVGREGTLQQQIDSAKEKIRSLAAGEGVFILSDRNVVLGIEKAKLEGLEKQLAAQVALNNQKERNVALIKNDSEVNKLLDQYVEKSDKKKKAIEEVNNVFNESIRLAKEDGKAVAEIEANRAKALAGIEEKFKVRTKKDPQENYFANLMLEAEKATVKAADATDELTKYQERMLVLIKDEKFLALPKQKQAEALAAFAAASAFEDQNKQIKEQLRLQLELQKAWDATVKAQTALDNRDFDALAASDAKLALLDEELADLILQKAIYGELSVEQKKQIEYAKIKRDLAKELADIENKRSKGTISDDAARELIENAYVAEAKKRQNIDQAIILENIKFESEQRREIANAFGDAIAEALFNGGKAGGKKFKAWLLKELQTRITLQIQANVRTNMQGGGANQLIQGASNFGSSLATEGLGSALSGGFMDAGAFLFNNGFQELGNTFLDFGNTIGNFSTTINQAGGYFDALSTMFSKNEFGERDYGEAIGKALGTYFGAGNPIFTKIGGEIGKLFGLTDDSGTMHTGGMSQYSASGGLQTSTEHGAFGMGFGGVDRGEKTIGMTSTLSKGIVGILDSTAKAFGKEAGYTAATGFADDRSKDGAWGGLLIKNAKGETQVNWNDDRTSRWAPREFANGEAGAKEYAAAVANDIRGVLIDQTPAWADTMLNALGESTTLEDLGKVVTQIHMVNASLKVMGEASVAFAGMSSEMITTMMDKLGGAESTVATLSDYYNKYYTASERAAISQKLMNDQFKALGETMPTSVEGMRSMVDAAIASGNSGLAAELLKLSGGFYEVANAATEANQAIASERLSLEEKLLTAQGDTVELRRRELEKLDPANRALQQRIWALEDAKEAETAAKNATDAAFNALKVAVEKEKSALNDRIKSIEATATALTSIFELLKDNVRELYAEVTATSNMQVQQAYAIISNARTTGVLPSQDVLSQAIGTVRGSFDSNNYASKFEADRARLLLANDLAALQGFANEQLTEAQQQIKLIKDQIEQYDLILEHAETQINELRGINTSVLSVTSAVDALTAALIEEKKLTDPSVTKPTQSGGVGFGGGTSGKSPDASTASRLGNTYYGSMGIAITDAAYVDRFDSVNSFVNTLDWSAGNKDASTAALIAAAQQYGVSANEIAIATGYSRDDVISLTGGQLPKFANGGYHSGGLRLVGENGPELEVTGPSRIYNASQTASMLSSNSDSNETTMLRAEVRSIAISTSKLQRIIDALVVPTSEGEAINVKVVV